MKRQSLALTLFFALILNTSAWAFPELIRHGYTHCTACHVAPTGGGTLTAYGRELSKELLSTWGRDGEQAFAYGIFKKSHEETLWLGGGDIRWIQTYRDNMYFREAQSFLMQADLEAAFQGERVMIDASLGGKLESQNEHLGFRRFFIGYRLSEELQLRAGKFYPAYGINIADHSRSIKKQLGFDEGMETANLELSWLGEKWGLYSTASLQVSDENIRAAERKISVAQQVNYAIGSGNRLGVSALYGEGNSSKTLYLGIHSMGELGGGFFFLSEVDYKRKTQVARSSISEAEQGWFRYFKLGYEVKTGWNLLAIHDSYHVGAKTTSLGKLSWGLGTQWFPRPHLELQATWYKTKMIEIDRDFGDVAALLLHYYL